jgi:hypothetical protein
MTLKVCLGVKHTLTDGGLGMKPNDSQVHFHFGNIYNGRYQESRICVGVVNIQILGWKGRKTPNWAPRIPLERSSSLDA